MGPGLAGIAAEGAIAAVIAAEIRERKKYFSGIGDDSRFEFCANGLRGR
jgi:hypothetical protein